MTGALSNIRVLDLSRILAGPWSGQLLGDLGAEVIKIERPGSGDDTRAWGPPWLKDESGADMDVSAYFLCANRNKRSVTVDITKPEGQDIVRRLAAVSDVLLENFKVGGLKAYGLDYDSLRAINPRLVYCSITGFGQDGPYSQRAGYDFLIQGMGGLMSITGQPDGAAGAGPQKVGVALTDILTGLYASNAILAALLHRQTTGEGQYVDLSLLDVQIASLANQTSNYLVSGKAPVRMGNAHPNIVPYQDFPTSDGDMIIATGNDGQFTRLCEALGHAEWSTDPRFLTNDKRVANRDILIPAMNEATRTRTTQEWVAILEKIGVPCGPINDLAGVFGDPHIQARGLAFEMRQEQSGAPVRLVSNPIHMSETPPSYRTAPPILGHDTGAVLSEILGLDAAAIAALAAGKII
jgi:crotonobetainyl-CoA:carnitine CoA-transferase CaiB-like acyl-CoA transferase